MSTAAKPPLRISASHLGPVIKLDGLLSKHAQNLVYARNGTGKSFLTRALRYLDLHGQGGDISDAAFNLVSEESASSQGAFSLAQGPDDFAKLELNLRAKQVSASTRNTIFHVFSDDFVQTELRQRNYDMDGNIESEIRLDQIIIDTKEVEDRLYAKNSEISRQITLLKNRLETQKVSELSTRASINRRLREYTELNIDRIIDLQTQPALPPRSFKLIVADLDALKSLPAEPDYPSEIAEIATSVARLGQIDGLLGKITSPSTVSEEIKNHIAASPDFFETGLSILNDSSTEECPFCRQSVSHPPTRNTIELYISYFADAEGQHKKELRTAWAEIKSLRGAARELLTAAAREASRFESLRKLVPSQRDVVLADIPGVIENLDSALIEYQEAIETKGKSPAASVSLPKIKIDAMLQEVRLAVMANNSAFLALTTAVAASEDERRRLQREACHAFEAEFAHSNWLSIAALHAYVGEAKGIEAELSALMKSQLSASVRERVAQTFEILIESFFGKKYAFDRARFVLNRDSKAMARGAARTLSDGEKTAIAFCYFIACSHKKVKASSDYSKLFFVFDDPITSMSYDYIFTIAQTLKNLSVGSGGEISINPADKLNRPGPSLIIFTHSSYFYNICLTNRVVKKEAAFFLYHGKGEHKLSIRTKYVAPFEQHLKEVFDVHSGRDPDHTTGNSIRSVLEAVGRFCHPDKSDSLSDFIAYLADEGGFTIKSVLINNLSHGTYYDEYPSPEELHEACGETLVIVEKYARGQLELVRALADGA